MKKEVIDWTSIIKDWEQSGESKKEYCIKRGISPSLMYNYSSRANRSKKKAKKPEKGFVEVPVDTSKGRAECIVIRLASGVSIEVPV